MKPADLIPRRYTTHYRARLNHRAGTVRWRATWWTCAGLATAIAALARLNQV